MGSDGQRQDEGLRQLWRGQRRDEAAACPDLVGRTGYEIAAIPIGPGWKLAPGSTSPISIVFVQDGRACPTGPDYRQANFANGVIPASLTDAGTGVSLIENVNLPPPGTGRAEREALSPARVRRRLWTTRSTRWAFEARYDRRRLDHVIEDASLADPDLGRNLHHRQPRRGREPDHGRLRQLPDLAGRCLRPPDGV